MVLKPDPQIAAEVTWPQVHAFRLRRHHLAARAPREDLARVVADIGGVQAQLMSAAELQVAVRVDCTVEDVRQALWKDRSLVKTWLMRGTLHLIRSEDLPEFTAAMSTRWIQTRPSWLKFMRITEPELWRLVDEIGAALDGTPLTREELTAIVATDKAPHIREILKSGWGGMLKPAARSGRLCFGPNRGQSVTFVRPERWLASWRSVDHEAALVEMGRRYLRAFGPATRSDFARWWGTWPGVGAAAWSGLAPELVTVSVEGTRLDALASDLESIEESVIEEPVQLLPAFDPYILGHASRDHLFDRAFASRVSRTAGWISACVLLDGSVVGTWTHAVKSGKLEVTVTPFRRLGSAINAAVKTRARELGRALSAEKTEVKFA